MTQLKLASTWDLESELGVGRVVQARSGAVDAVIQFGPKTAGAEREMLFAELGDARNVVPIIGCGETSDSWVRQWHQKALLIYVTEMANWPLVVKDAIKAPVDICTAPADLGGRLVHRESTAMSPISPADPPSLPLAPTAVSPSTVSQHHLPPSGALVRQPCPQQPSPGSVPLSVAGVAATWLGRV